MKRIENFVLHCPFFCVLASALLVALGSTVALTALAQPALIELTREQREALEIEVTSLVPAEGVTSVSHPARVVVPNDQVRVVAAGQSGLIETLLVAVGDDVSAGQPLVHIHSPELLSTQREFLQALAQLELARSTADREEQLANEGIVPGRRALESRTALAQKETRAEELRRWLELVGMSQAEITELERKRRLQPTLVIRAPFEAVVLEQMAEAGRRVGSADPLYRLGVLDPLLLELHAPLELAARVRVGDEVYVPDADVTGRVVAVGRSVHAVDQGVLVRAEVQKGAGRLRPGQFVRAKTRVPIDTTAGGRFTIPRPALMRAGTDAFVFVEADGGFLALPVDVLGEEGDLAVVALDVATSAAVVTQGTAPLKTLWLESNGAP